jgi:hypothetical protein
MQADVALLSPLISQLRKLRGYTFIEVTAAICIIATLGGITIMWIGDMNTEANNPDRTIPPPIVTLSSPPGGEPFLAGQNIPLTATVTSLEYISEVVFCDNGTIVGAAADRIQAN